MIPRFFLTFTSITQNGTGFVINETTIFRFKT
jgi:hypothetical protein